MWSEKFLKKEKKDEKKSKKSSKKEFLEAPRLAGEVPQEIEWIEMEARAKNEAELLAQLNVYSK